MFYPLYCAFGLLCCMKNIFSCITCTTTREGETSSSSSEAPPLSPQQIEDEGGFYTCAEVKITIEQPPASAQKILQDESTLNPQMGINQTTTIFTLNNYPPHPNDYKRHSTGGIIQSRPLFYLPCLRKIILAGVKLFYVMLLGLLVWGVFESICYACCLLVKCWREAYFSSCLAG